MGNLTRFLLWFYVFTVSWDTVSLPLVGSASRALGLAVVAYAILTTTLQGRLRKPDAVLGFAIAFTAWSALSLLWTLSYDSTLSRVITYVQLVASLWVFREFVRTRDQLQPLMAAFCLGSFVPLIDLVNNFRAGIAIGQETSRFSGSGLNADTLGFSLVLGVPMAWHLLRNRQGIVRVAAPIVGVAALAYVVLAPIALLLTGTRGAFLAGIVALTIVPITLPRQSLRSYALAGVVVTVVAVSAALVVPRSNWDRILSISSEVTEGKRMSGRMGIWRAGLQAFPEHPLIGAGAGAYGSAVEPYLHNTQRIFAHNMGVGLLVEGGIIGVSLFAAILGACALAILRSPPPHRAVWGVLLLTWLVGAMSGDWDNVKLTWVLFGLIAAQSGLKRTVSEVTSFEQRAVAAAVAVPFLSGTERAAGRSYR